MAWLSKNSSSNIVKQTVGCGEDAWDLDPVHDPVPPPPVQADDGAAESAWAEFNRKNRRDALQFFKSSPGDALLVAVQSLSITSHCFHIIERLGGEDYQLEMAFARLQGAPCATPLQSVLGDVVARHVLAKSVDLLESPAQWSLLKEKTWSMGGLAFSAVSKSICGLEQKLFKVWRGYPYKLWELLNVDADHRWTCAHALLADFRANSCLLDSFSKAFLMRFSI